MTKLPKVTNAEGTSPSESKQDRFFLDRRAAGRARKGRIEAALDDWAALEASGQRSRRFQRIVDAFLQDGDFDTALALVRQSVDRMPLSESSQLKVLFRMAGWLAREGHLSEAVAIMDGLPNKGTREGQRRALASRFLQEFKVLDEYHLHSIAGWIDAETPGPVLRRMLDLVATRPDLTDIFDDMADRTLAFLPGLPVEERIDILRFVVGPWALRKRTDKLSEAFRQWPDEIMAVAHKSPYLAVWIREHCATSDLSSEIADMAEFHDLRAAGSKQMRRVLADPSIRIAVVGNSPCENGLGKGPEIDDHDLVIRFNYFDLGPEFQTDYGTRIDVAVLSPGSFQPFVTQTVNTGLQAMMHSKTPFFWQSGRPDNVLTPNIRHALDSLGIPLCQTEMEAFDALRSILHATPSSGMQVLWTLFHERGGFHNVRTYGFSFVDQIGTQRASSNYFRVSAPNLSHNWPAEAVLLQAMKTEKIPDRLPTKLTAPDLAFGPRRAFRPLRFRLIGDHSEYHCGCRAVMQYLRAHLETFGVLVEDDSYDILVVNGEGSMHHNRRHHVAKLEALRDALDAGKRGMLVNTVWQDNDDRFDDVLRRLSFISAREIRSQQALSRDHGVEAQMFLDCSYWASIGKPVHQVDFRGKLVTTDFYSWEFGNFVKLTNGSLARNATYVSMKDFDWAGLVHSLKSAKMLVTGRHHAFFAACKAEIPFVVMPGNTHKIEGVIEASGIDIPICTDPSQIPAAIRWARANKPRYAALFKWMRAQPKLALPGHTLFRDPDTAAHSPVSGSD